MSLRKPMGRGYEHDDVGARYDAPGVVIVKGRPQGNEIRVMVYQL